MVFPDSDYDNSAFSVSGNSYTFTHKAWGADMIRYSANFGRNWTQWQPFEEKTTLNATLFQDKDNFWEGEHVMVQCKHCRSRQSVREINAHRRLQQYHDVGQRCRPCRP